MSFEKTLKTIRGTSLAVGFLALSVLGCGSSAQLADVTPGPMPEGGSFTGVFFSSQYGEMQLVQTGASVLGEYHKDERNGRIQGTAHGNILRFEWSEHRELVVGRPQTTRGRGYFKYMVDSNGDHVLVGEWGVDNNEVGGGPWRAVKSRNRRPELNNSSEGSTAAPESSDTSGGSDW